MKLFFLFVLLSLNSFASSQMREIEQHNSEKDCWMVIESKVYNITDYITQHPAPKKLILDWCGKEATEAWRTKGAVKKGHSQRAKLLLKKYELVL